MRKCLLLLALCCFLLQTKAQVLDWREFKAQVFADARKQHKLVLLDLKANWCHWCHVMDDSTYSNPIVQRYLKQHFIIAQADQDKRPDLATRYKDYGWPATVIFTANGHELDKQAGFFTPHEFLQLLKAAVQHPVPEKTARKNPVKQAGKNRISKLLEQKFRNSLDLDHGGFSFEQKYIDFDTYEYAFSGQSKDQSLRKWLTVSTREAATNLMDTVWGGVYQYSTNSDWQHVHFEKLLGVQARYLKMFSWYAQVFHAPWALQGAKHIVAYCDRFLGAKDGTYYNAQDADVIKGEKATAYFKLDDQQRLRQGIPAIDQHSYTNVNAQMAESLLTLWAVSGEVVYCDKALKLLDFLQTHRSRSNGGYGHEGVNESLLTLSDQLYMARALFYAYRATGNGIYLEQSKQASAFILTHFAGQNGAFNSYIGNNGLLPQPVVAENIELCRFFNLLSYSTEDLNMRSAAKKTLQWLLSPAVQEEVVTEPGMLSALHEIGQEPLSATLLFYGHTPDTENMLRQTLASPVFYLLNHTYRDKNELPDEKKVLFEDFNQPVLFFCNSRFCSAPVFDSDGVAKYLREKISGL